MMTKFGITLLFFSSLLHFSGGAVYAGESCPPFHWKFLTNGHLLSSDGVNANKPNVRMKRAKIQDVEHAVTRRAGADGIDLVVIDFHNGPSEQYITDLDAIAAGGIPLGCADIEGNTLLMGLARLNIISREAEKIATFSDILLQHDGMIDGREDREGRNVVEIAEASGNTVLVDKLRSAMQAKSIRFGTSHHQQQVAAEERQRAAAEQAYQDQTARFRRQLQTGDETTIGLVVEVRRPLAKLQTTQEIINHYTEWLPQYREYGTDYVPEQRSSSSSLPVEKWMKIEELFPLRK